MDTRPNSTLNNTNVKHGNGGVPYRRPFLFGNQEKHQVSDFSYTGDDSKLVLVLVGLPARGKTFIARKISSYLSWLGIRVRWFNVGYYRRLCATNTVGTSSANFFDPHNTAATKQRELFALLALAELEKYLKEGGEVAILDGTNTTKARRTLIRNFFARNPQSKRKRRSSHASTNTNTATSARTNGKRNKYANKFNKNNNHNHNQNHNHKQEPDPNGSSSQLIRDLSDPHYRDSAYGSRNNNQDRGHGGNDVSNHFGGSGSLSPHSGSIERSRASRGHSRSHSRSSSRSQSNSRGRGHRFGSSMKPIQSNSSSISSSSSSSSSSNRSNTSSTATADNLDGSKVQIVYIESICNDPLIIEQNIIRVKLNSPDYADVPPQEAVRDFKRRIKHYEKVYEQVDESDGSYIKMINAGKHVVGHQVNGYLPARILYFLMHLNLEQVPIFLSRHGESEYNIQNRIGGNASLSPAGRRYSQTMCDFITLQPEFRNGLNVWCSTLKRTMETAQPFRGMCPIYKWKALSEIEAGICDGMTYAQIKYDMPNEWNQRKIDKLTYRYPQGESYKDVIQRLEPVIFELERATKPVLVIAHRAVLRCLYAYFMDKPLKDIPYLPMELHTVYKLKPSDYKTEMDKFTFGFLASRTARSSVEKDTYFDDIDNNEHLPMYQFHNKMRKKYKLLKATDSDDSDSEYNQNRNVTPLTLNSHNQHNLQNGSQPQLNRLANGNLSNDSMFRPLCNHTLSYADLQSLRNANQSFDSNSSNSSLNSNQSNQSHQSNQSNQSYQNNPNNQNQRSHVLSPTSAALSGLSSTSHIHNHNNNENKNNFSHHIVQGYDKHGKMSANGNNLPLSRYQRNHPVFSYHRSKQFGDQMMDGRSIADSIDSTNSFDAQYNQNQNHNQNQNNSKLHYQVLRQSQTPPFTGHGPLNGPASHLKKRKSKHYVDVNTNKQTNNDDSNSADININDSNHCNNMMGGLRPSMSSPNLSKLGTNSMHSNNKSRKAIKVNNNNSSNNNCNNDNNNNTTTSSNNECDNEHINHHEDGSDNKNKNMNKNINKNENENENSNININGTDVGVDVE